MNYPENKDEKIRDIFVKDIVKDKLNVKVDSSEIQAIHRIPGKIGEARPVIVKLVNSEMKYRIMRAKKNLSKKETVRLGCLIYWSIAGYNLSFVVPLLI
jgi:hypothetical protein